VPARRAPAPPETYQEAPGAAVVSPEANEATAKSVQNDKLEAEIMNHLLGQGSVMADAQELRFQQLSRISEMLKDKEEAASVSKSDASTAALTALIKNINAAAINIQPIKLSTKSKELDKASFLLWVEEFDNGCEMQSITNEHEKFSFFKGNWRTRNNIVEKHRI
jgi:hypothetical protein